MSIINETAGCSLFVYTALWVTCLKPCVLGNGFIVLTEVSFDTSCHMSAVNKESGRDKASYLRPVYFNRSWLAPSPKVWALETCDKHLI